MHPTTDARRTVRDLSRRDRALALPLADTVAQTRRREVKAPPIDLSPADARQSALAQMSGAMLHPNHMCGAARHVEVLPRQGTAPSRHDRNLLPAAVLQERPPSVATSGPRRTRTSGAALSLDDEHVSTSVAQGLVRPWPWRLARYAGLPPRV